MKIVLPVDSSPASNRGVEVARDYAKKFEAELYLVNVQGEPVELAAAQKRGVFPEFTREYLEEIAKGVFEGVRPILGDDLPGPVHEVILFGHIADQICGYAEQIDADLIIIGSRGLKTVKRFLLGSVANHVVPHAPCSVLVIKEKNKK